MVKNIFSIVNGGIKMYAIIETGGKQYRVSEGETLKIEKIDNKKSVTFNNVLMVSDGDKATYGDPFIKSAKVSADVVDNGKAKKVLVFKQKPRKGFRSLRGHRQLFTAVKIKSISLSKVSEEIKDGS
jgi:large subunit ribosomal protein L21